MTAYIIRRLLAFIPLLIAVSFIVFFLIRSVPGDPVDVLLGEKATPERREELTKKWGLDQPIFYQYWVYMKGIVTRLDFGESYIRTGRTINSEIGRHLPATIELTFFAMILSTVGGIFLGILAARHKGTWIDYSGMGVALLGVSIPVFWLGLLLLTLLGGLFATSQAIAPQFSVPMITGFLLIDTLLAGDLAAFLDVLRHMFLPALALGSIPMAITARITRNSMLEVLDSDYVRTARAKGLPEERVVMTHALKNALIPIVTILGLEFGYLLGGAVLTETVFDWPGMGRYVLNSIMNRDYMAISGSLMVLAAIFVVMNLVVDLLYAWIDPRVRYG